MEALRDAKLATDVASNPTYYTFLVENINIFLLDHGPLQQIPFNYSPFAECRFCQRVQQKASFNRVNMIYLK